MNAQNWRSFDRGTALARYGCAMTETMTPTSISPRILVADDQPDILDALRLLLREAGFRSDAARSIQDVRERVVGGGYDLLLMDLNYARDTTSGREGLDLLAEVHEHDPTLPVIVMTGWGSIDTAVEAMRRGARTFVHKPWDNAVLAQTVRREVDEGVALRQAGARALREHEDARLIQRALLPASLPSIAGCDVAAIWEPASDFGGDCYDVLRFDERRIGLSIADVAGKGLPAAFLMSNLQASVRAFAGDHAAPQRVADSINRSLCANARLRRFVTLFYAVLDLDARTMVFSNAGHNPPMLVRADGSVHRLSSGGTVLGVFDDATYEQREIALRPGDRLVLFTDGITEAENADGEEFGDTRLVDTVLAQRHASARAAIDAIFDRVRDFTAGVFRDDATLIAVAVD
jgi:sigma-B regulation protein RsbU (phosphoserine phosphatase)